MKQVMTLKVKLNNVLKALIKDSEPHLKFNCLPFITKDKDELYIQVFLYDERVEHLVVIDVKEIKKGLKDYLERRRDTDD